MKSIVARLVTIPIFVWTTAAFANAGITYHGRLMKSNGTAVTAANVQFHIQIRTPGSENCLMYQETQVKNLSGTSGMFSLTINDGTATVPNSEPFSLSQVFRNHGTFNFTAGKCSGGTTYSPNPTDGRKLVVEFNDGSGWEILPSQNINYVPMAIESETVGGRTPYSFLRVDDAAANTTDNSKELTLSDLTELWALLGGTSSQYMKSSSSGASLPSFTSSPSGHQEGNIWYDSTDHKLRFDDGSTVQTVGTSGGSVTGVKVGEGLVDADGNTGTTIVTNGTVQMPDVGTPDTYYKVTTDSKGRVASGATSLTDDDLPLIDKPGKVSGNAITSGTIGGTAVIDTDGAITTSGDLSVRSITASGNITNNGDGSTTGVIYGATLQTRRLKIYDDGTNNVTIKTPSSLTTGYTWTLPPNQGAAGDVLSTDASGNLSWISPTTGSVTSVSGTSPLTVDNSTPAAPSLSIAQANASTDGYLSKDDWTTFNNKLDSVQGSAQLDDGKIWIGDSSGKAQATALTGDLSITDTGVTSVNQIKGYSLDFTTAPVSGNFLKYTGSHWIAAVISESDITDLADDLSDKISVGQMPANCSSGQTLTFSSPSGTWQCSSITITASNFGSQAANTVLAAPTGTGGTPTFRALASADIPDLDASKITTGHIATTILATGAANNTKYLRGDGTWALGPVSTSVTTESSDYSLTSDDGVVLGDASGGTVTLTLPDASGLKGHQYTLKKTDSSSNDISIATSSSQTIDGDTSYSLSKQWQYVTLVSDGSNWNVIADASGSSSSVQFAFTDVTSANTIESQTISTTGTGSTTIVVAGPGNPEISINGGSWGTGGIIAAGQTLAIRQTPAGTAGTTYTATVTLANGSTVDWNVKTADCTAGSQVFSYTGADQTFTVPAGCTSIQVKAWGAGGGGGSGIPGGAGGYATGFIATLGGTSLTVRVGQGGIAGGNNNLSTSVYGGGAKGGSSSGVCWCGGGGGGYSGIFDGSTPLIIAGAGGGAGAGSGNGGVGGGSAGGDGTSSGGGKGGTQIAGGAAGTDGTYPGQAGSQFQGGAGWDGDWPGGGGGGGYYGGGGGARQNGGGGGSSYLGSMTYASTQNGSGTTPPETTDPDYVTGVGVGGPGSTGGNGLIVLTWGP